jgi:ATP-binding cassette subfamily C (CFTR/MRP) protein 4
VVVSDLCCKVSGLILGLTVLTEVSDIEFHQFLFQALRLSKTALGETTVGQAVNLLSNDVARFDRTFLVMAFLVIAPVETMIIVYFMWSKIGISAVIGVVSILLVIPVQGMC